MLLGGSFNPLHVGHLRMVFEVERALHPKRMAPQEAGTAPHPNRTPPQEAGTALQPNSTTL